MDTDELKIIQEKLSKKVKIQSLHDFPQYVGGFDVHECYQDQGIGVLVVFDFLLKSIIETQVAHDTFKIPYVSGFLGFRELPFFEKVWEQVKIIPDVVVLDGHGIMHPRRLGLASHLGVEFDIPTFGIAKQPLLYEFQEPSVESGSWTFIKDDKINIGVCLRTKTNTKPVFVSAGHKITLEEAMMISLDFAKYRIPELTRKPDMIARKNCRGLLS